MPSKGAARINEYSFKYFNHFLNSFLKQKVLKPWALDGATNYEQLKTARGRFSLMFLT